MKDLTDFLNSPVKIVTPAGGHLEQELLAVDAHSIVTCDLVPPFALHVLPRETEIMSLERSGFVPVARRAAYHYSLNEAIRVRSLKFENYDNYWQALRLVMQSISAGGMDDEMVDSFFRTWSSYLDFAFKTIAEKGLGEEDLKREITQLLEKDAQLCEFFSSLNYDSLTYYGVKEAVNRAIILGLGEYADNLKEYVRHSREKISGRDPLGLPPVIDEVYEKFFNLYLFECRLSLFAAPGMPESVMERRSSLPGELYALEASFEERKKEIIIESGEGQETRIIDRLSISIKRIEEEFNKRRNLENVGKNHYVLNDGFRRKSLYKMLLNISDRKRMKFNVKNSDVSVNLNGALWSYIDLYRVLPYLFNISPEEKWKINDTWYIAGCIMSIHADKLKMSPEKAEKYRDRISSLGIVFNQANIRHCTNGSALVSIIESMEVLGFEIEQLLLIDHLMAFSGFEVVRVRNKKEKIEDLQWHLGKRAVIYSVRYGDSALAESFMKKLEKLLKTRGNRYEDQRELDELRRKVSRISDIYNVSEDYLKKLIENIRKEDVEERITRRNNFTNALKRILEYRKIASWNASYLGTLLDCSLWFLDPRGELFDRARSILVEAGFRTKCPHLIPKLENPEGWVDRNRMLQMLDLFDALYRAFNEYYDYKGPKIKFPLYFEKVRKSWEYLESIGVDKDKLRPFITLFTDEDVPIDAGENFFLNVGLSEETVQPVFDDLWGEEIDRMKLMNGYLKNRNQFIGLLNRLNLGDDMWLLDFLKQGLEELTEKKGRTFKRNTYKNPGAAAIYEFLADHEEDNGLKRALLDKGLRYVDPIFKGKKYILYDRMKEKRDNVRLGGLTELRLRHYPILTACVWSRFNNGHLKYLTHGGQMYKDMSYRAYFEEYMVPDFYLTVRNIREMGYRLPENMLRHIAGFITGEYKDGEGKVHRETWKGVGKERRAYDSLSRFGDMVLGDEDRNPFDHDANKPDILEFKDTLRFYNGTLDDDETDEGKKSFGGVQRFIRRYFPDAPFDRIEFEEKESSNFYAFPLNFYDVIQRILNVFTMRLRTGESERLKIKVESSSPVRPVRDRLLKADSPGTDVKISTHRVSFIDLGRAGAPDASKIENLGGDIGEYARKSCGFCDYVIKNPESEISGISYGRKGTAVYRILTTRPLSQGLYDPGEIVRDIGREWEETECPGFTHEFTFYNIYTDMGPLLGSPSAK